MKKVLLALGEENFSALFRKEFDTYEHPDIAFDVLSDEILSRNFLEPLTKMYTPDYLVIHDTFLSTTAQTAKERDEEILQILKSIRLQSPARIVYICQRENEDYFLSHLVALGIYDIFNEQAINAVKFIEQVAKPAQLSNVLKWTEDLSAIQGLDVRTEPETAAPAEEKTKSVTKPKKSIFAQFKRLSPFKVTSASVPVSKEEFHTIEEPAELVENPTDLAELTVAEFPFTVEETNTVQSRTEPIKNVIEEAPPPIEPIVEPVALKDVHNDTPFSIKSVSVEDIFTQTIQPVQPLKPTEPIKPVQTAKSVQHVTSVQQEPIETFPVKEEPVHVFPSMPSTLEEDFLLTKPVDTFDALTKPFESKAIEDTSVGKSSPAVESNSAIQSNVTESLSSENYTATLSSTSHWQDVLNDYEPFQARGQYATIYAVGHLARDNSTTQFAINCAVLLREQYEKVAYVELNQNLNLEYVQAFATGTQPFENDDYYFSAHGITHFKFKVGLPLQDILQRFDAVVLDLGMISNLHPYKSYFERSNYRLLLTPTYQWSWHLVDTFIHYDQHALTDYQFVMLNATKHELNSFKRIYGNRVQLQSFNSTSHLYELADEEKQALRSLIGLKRGGRLKSKIIPI